MSETNEVGCELYRLWISLDTSESGLKCHLRQIKAEKMSRPVSSYVNRTAAVLSSHHEMNQGCVLCVAT